RCQDPLFLGTRCSLWAQSFSTGRLHRASLDDCGYHMLNRTAMPKKPLRPHFAVFVANEGCDDLQVWKLYRVLPDARAAEEGYLGVVDDSGEDYLYPAGRFVIVEFSAAVARKLLVLLDKSRRRIEEAGGIPHDVF